MTSDQIMEYVKLGYGFYNGEDDFKPTKAQINAVVDRCVELGCPEDVPHWAHQD